MPETIQPAALTVWPIITGELKWAFATSDRNIQGTVSPQAAARPSWPEELATQINRQLRGPWRVWIRGYGFKTLTAIMSTQQPATDGVITAARQLSRRLNRFEPNSRLSNRFALKTEPIDGIDHSSVAVAGTDSSVDSNLTAWSAVTGGGWYIAAHMHGRSTTRAMWIASFFGLLLFPRDGLAKLLCQENVVNEAWTMSANAEVPPILPQHLSRDDYDAMLRLHNVRRIVTEPCAGTDPLSLQASSLSQSLADGQLRPTTRLLLDPSHRH